jgi:hypothetical protein
MHLVNANINIGRLRPIIFGSCIALTAPMDATADLVTPELSTHTPDIVLLADGPFAIDPQSHYLNVHSLTRANVAASFGPTNPPQNPGGNRSGGAAAASAGGGGGQGGTDAEKQGLETRTERPALLPFPTDIAGHEIPENWSTEPVAAPGAEVPQIPIPSAAVLLGSALLGLIGFGLRARPKRSLTSRHLQGTSR